MIREKNYEDNVDKLISFEQTDWINEENQNTRLIKKLSQSNGLFIRGIAKDITSDVIQRDKQPKKTQKQRELNNDHNKRQKRFSARNSKQTEWFQWPGPCSDDNHCPPNLYCVNGSCWHLSNKPIRIQRKHDSLMNTKEQDRSHLAIHHQLFRLMGTATSEVLSKIETTTRNLSVFGNLDLFDYTTSTTVTTAAIIPTTKLKMTIGNYQKEQKLVATNNSRTGTDGDNLSKSSFIDLRFSTEFPVQTEYIRKRQLDKPIRIELYLARAVLRDECSQDSHCGHRMICCRKTWYDLSDDSGIGYFCLPDCEFTKKVSLGIHEANGLIPNDLIYD
uniref:Bm2240, isoform e n=1 Tax=Brugia malayi TaxID=6279 RepID=A0A1I9G1B3_BRUMA|nr:Bm2240, isoform e [Brugia malayi]